MIGLLLKNISPGASLNIFQALRRFSAVSKKIIFSKVGHKLGKIQVEYFG